MENPPSIPAESLPWITEGLQGLLKKKRGTPFEESPFMITYRFW